MSAMRKIGEYLGLLEDTGVYDDEYDEHGYADQEPQRRTQVPAKAPRASPPRSPTCRSGVVRRPRARSRGSPSSR